MPVNQIAPGAFGEGAEFEVDEMSCYAQLYRVIGHDTDLQEDFTVEFQAKWLDNGFIRQAYWRYRNPNTGEASWALNLIELFGDIILTLYTQPAGESQTVAATYTAEGFADSNWHHYAASYDRAGDVILYIDGAEVASAAAPFVDVEMTEDVSSRLELTGAGGFASAFYLDNVAFLLGVSDPADILDRAQNGLPGD